MKWQRLTRGMYKANADKPRQFMAFVFRCPPPTQLWAWCVWEPNFVEHGGVEFTREKAKEKVYEVSSPRVEPGTERKEA